MVENKDVLRFPPDFSLGRIIVYSEGYSEPQAILEAIGTVEVPERSKVLLDLNQEVCDDLQKLCLAPHRLLADGGVQISQKRLDRTDLGALRAVPDLKILVVSLCGAIRTEQLRQLGKLESLEHLDLSGTELDRGDFSWVGQFPRLKWLSLADTSADEKCLHPLSDLLLLQHLDLGRAKLTDEAVQSIWSFPTLNSLILAGCDIGDGALRGIEFCRSLQCLHVPKTSISDTGVESIVRQAEVRGLHLRTLGLRWCRVTDKSLVHLSSLASLRLVDLWGTAVTAEGIAFLRQIRPNCTVIVERSKTPTSPQAGPT